MEDSATSLPSSIWASLNSWFTSTVFFVLLNLMIATIVFTSNSPNSNKKHHQDREEQQQKQSSHNNRNQPRITRSPSIIDRVKSFNFYLHRSQHDYSPETHHHHEPLEETATQYVFNQHLHYQHFGFDPTISDQITNAEDQFSVFNQTCEPGHTETPIVWEGREQIAETVMTHFDYEPTTGFEDAHEEQQADEFQSLDEVYSKLKGELVDRTKSNGELTPKPPAKMKKSASLKVGFSHPEEDEIVKARRPATVRDRKSEVSVMDDDDDVEVDSKADDFINKFKNDLKLQRIESIIRTKGGVFLFRAKTQVTIEMGSFKLREMEL